jgi:hypothetical protein
MPKISPSKVPGAGSDVQQKQTMRQRLMERFAGHEWVRVINIDDEPYIWLYLPSHAEDFEFTPDPMKITRRGEVEAYQLDPGESEVILGENAYIMIEGLYKRLAGKAVINRSPNVAPGYARSFNWDDGVQQEEFIERIYLGKEDPSFRRALPKASPIRTQVDTDLELKAHENSQPTRMRQEKQRA